MVAYWREGYTATSYRGLESMSGVGIRGLANTFGEKDELYSRSLVRYRLMVTDNLAQMFNPPFIEAIAKVFERVSSPAEPANPRRFGCLMVNTIFEIDEQTPTIASEISSHPELRRNTLLQALEADQIADAPTRAEFLVGALWGALAQIRLASDPRASQPMTSVIIGTIRSWQ
jgi:TetR/AcrR family transcriptional repressor of nem operon